MSKVKKSISIILSLIMVLSLFTAVPFTAGAVKADKVSTEAQSGNYEYEVFEDDTAEITKYNGVNGNAELEIPRKLDGYTVTGIGYSAFEECTSLKSITIPDSVTHIGYGAFGGCTSLTNIAVDTNNEDYTSLG